MQARTIQQLFNLDGRTALVTGGSRGLGLQMAHALGEAGARVMISARKAEELERAAAELKEAGINVLTAVADVSREADVMALAESAMQSLGQVDILVNNAGATWGALAEEHPLDAWDKVMNLNVRGLFLLTREIGKRSMIPRRSGKVVNIASVAALGGNVKLMQAIGYHTSKGAVLTFTRALAAEWGRYGINVNAIGPGVFPSKMANGMIDHVGADKIKENIPLNRLGDDEDLKGPLLLLASDAGKHLSGVFIPVDGGASAVIAG
jgi:NAD(P)-dependent dehydrogenase (short-subunit alcohol dehydrogenase family)